MMKIPMFKMLAKSASILLLLFLSFINASPALASTLALSPATGQFNQGCTFSVQVLLDTQKVDTDGTDAILTYDPTKLQATSIISGTLYPDFPNNSIDAASGKVSIYGLASGSQVFNGNGLLATVNFEANTAATGDANVTFDFDSTNPTKTTDSNVIQHSSLADTLASVTNGKYTISASNSTCGDTSNATITTATPVPTPDTLPDGGTTETTLIGLILSLGLIAFGILAMYYKKI